MDIKDGSLVFDLFATIKSEKLRFFGAMSIIFQVIIFLIVTYVLSAKVGLSLALSIFIALLFSTLERVSAKVLSEVIIYNKRLKGKLKNVEQPNDVINPNITIFTFVIFAVTTLGITLYLNTTKGLEEKDIKVNSITLSTSPQYHEIKELENKEIKGIESEYNSKIKSFEQKDSRARQKAVQLKNTQIAALKSEIQRCIAVQDLRGEIQARQILKDLENSPIIYPSVFQDSINNSESEKGILLAQITKKYAKSIEYLRENLEKKREYESGFSYFKIVSLDAFVVICALLTLIFTYQFECYKRLKIVTPITEVSKELEKIQPRIIDQHFDNIFFQNRYKIKINHNNIRNWKRYQNMDKLIVAIEILEQNGYCVDFTENDTPIYYKKAS